MNDIEKEIEGISDDLEETNNKEEEDTIKGIINHDRDDDKRKKIIMYVVIGILLFVLVGLILFIVFDRDEDVDNDVNNNIDETVNGDTLDEEEDSVKLGYVSCDDNTALLNVRNSTSGDIIDGLSCYKEVTIDEELDGTDVCDKWYKISYDKNGSNYTGYACGTYIKNLEISANILNNTRMLIDKANDYYENNVLKAYCGDTDGGKKTISFSDNMTGEYVKSSYKNIDELKSYLYSFMDKNLIKVKLELSDINNPKYYDNYYEIDGNLYCRNYAGKGWLTYYTGNYDIEITGYSDNKISANIAYQYINENSDCKLDDLPFCSRNDFVYEIGTINIDSGIITKMDFHK